MANEAEPEAGGGSDDEGVEWEEGGTGAGVDDAFFTASAT